MSGEVTQFQKAPQEVSVMYTLPQVSYVFSLNAVEKGQYQIEAKKPSINTCLEFGNTSCWYVYIDERSAYHGLTEYQDNVYIRLTCLQDN